MVALVDSYGVPADRFALQARAHFDPVSTNDTTSGQMKNRRVVIRVYPPKKARIE
jgi:flagellar motor protein MotB